MPLWTSMLTQSHWTTVVEAGGRNKLNYFSGDRCVVFRAIFLIENGCRDMHFNHKNIVHLKTIFQKLSGVWFLFHSRGRMYKQCVHLLSHTQTEIY